MRHNFLQARLWFWKIRLTYQNADPRTCWNLCQKVSLPEKINLAKKPEPNLLKLLLKKCSRFYESDFAENNLCHKNGLCKTKLLACQNFAWKPWSRFWKPEKIWHETFEPKTWANFEANKILEITAAKRLDLKKTKLLLKLETWFWRFKR